MAGIVGLRETVTVVNSHDPQLNHLGARPVKLSTQSDANRLSTSAVYETLFAHMVASAHKSLRQELDTLVYLIDSINLKLNNLSDEWARFSEEVCGSKLHIIHDPDANQPIRAVFSAANVNDITVAWDMSILPGATYVFDLGYYHFGWWQTMHEKGYRFGTRLKTNTKLTVTSERRVRSDAAILSDRTGRLPARLAGSRRNPFRDEVCEVRVHTDTGKILRVVTNDLNAPAPDRVFAAAHGARQSNGGGQSARLRAIGAVTPHEQARHHQAASAATPARPRPDAGYLQRCFALSAIAQVQRPAVVE